MRFTCPTLDAPSNGTIDCSLGRDGLLTNRDICRFTCNPGFVLRGSTRRRCIIRGIWNGQDTTCTPGIYCYLILYGRGTFRGYLKILETPKIFNLQQENHPGIYKSSKQQTILFKVNKYMQGTEQTVGDSKCALLLNKLNFPICSNRAVSYSNRTLTDYLAAI